MDTLRNVRDELEDLERRNLISTKSIKVWLLLLGITTGLFSYTWNKVFSSAGFEHFPPSMLPNGNTNDRMYFTSEAEARIYSLREINLVILANPPTDKDSDMTQAAADAILTMKSAVMFSKKVLHFHIFTNDQTYHYFIQELDRWPNTVRHRVSFKFHAVLYTEAMYNVHMTNGAPLLFVPHILKGIDRILYVESGGIFLASLDELWMTLKDFSKDQVIALLPSSSETQCQKSSRKNHIHKVFSASAVLWDFNRLKSAVFSVPVKFAKSKSMGDSFNLETDKFIFEQMTWNPHVVLFVANLFAGQMQLNEEDILNVIAMFNPSKVHQLHWQWNIDNTFCKKLMNNWSEYSYSLHKKANLVFANTFNSHSFIKNMTNKTVASQFAAQNNKNFDLNLTVFDLCFPPY